MHFIYGFCNGNARRSVIEYRLRYPNRRIPHRSVFTRVHRHLLENGNFNNLIIIGRPRARVEDEEAVLGQVQNNPNVSIREVSRNLEIPKTRVGRILREQLLHPFHYQKVQSLEERDFASRVALCNWMLENQVALNNVLWTDECQFTNNGIFNFHNWHYWSDENPHVIRRQDFQHRFSVNLWAGIVNNQLIGPFVIPDRLNANTYLLFLQNNLNDLLEDVNLNVRQNMILQMDGAPAHYGRNVRNWLNVNYPGRWIGRGGPFSWPPRSPDLSCLDFYLWGYMKQLVYKNQINTRDELMERIEIAKITITQNLQQFNVIGSIIRRSEACILNNGGHFEQFL